MSKLKSHYINLKGIKSLVKVELISHLNEDVLLAAGCVHQSKVNQYSSKPKFSKTQNFNKA